MPRRSTTDATRILADIAGPSAARRRAFAEECAHREVARRLYALRKQAGVSQAELARRVEIRFVARRRLEPV